MTATKDSDGELEAIRGVMDLLGPLDGDARNRVIDYVFRRLQIERQGPLVPAKTPVDPLKAAGVGPGGPPALPSKAPGAFQDIRSLREEKQPRNAVEMAALVGYYLSQVAPEGERTDTFGTKELDKYFKQAGYPVPATPRIVMFNGKNAGYFDAKEHGKYKLNPVGYNLVVHALPASNGQPTRPRSKSKRPAGRSNRK
jgi:hypothetical protein